MSQPNSEVTIVSPDKTKAIISLVSLILGTLIVAVSLSVLASLAVGTLFAGIIIILFGILSGYTK